MGRIQRFCSASQHVPARCRGERECSQGAKYWWLVYLQLQRLGAGADTAGPEGELIDLIDEFSDGRVQFAFVKVKDPNTSLPKYVLIGWCGEGVPERTEGYFTSHLAAVSKTLHVSVYLNQSKLGYKVSDRPLGISRTSHRSFRSGSHSGRHSSEGIRCIRLQIFRWICPYRCGWAPTACYFETCFYADAQ